MPSVVVIAGPTGVGKTRVAIDLALRIRGEIVNYDSVQIYRGFDIGSAKPTREERDRVPHHLIDTVDATEPFDAAMYADRAADVCDRLIGEGKIPILVGGTGFYLRALLGQLPDLPGRDDAVRGRIQSAWSRPRGPLWLFRWLSRVDPVTAEKVSSRDRYRVERALEVWASSGKPISSWNRPSAEALRYDATRFALAMDRTDLKARLDERVSRMYDTGLIEETRALLERFPREAKPFQSIGYREAAACVVGEMEREDAVAETRRRTRAYAKRQMTWLRGEPDVTWINAAGEASEIAKTIESVLPKASSDIVSP